MKIDTQKARRGLKPRPAPYFQKVRQGIYVGYRAGADTWVARVLVNGRNKHEALGDALTFDEAAERTLAWAKLVGAVENPDYSVGQAARAYLDYLHANCSTPFANGTGYRFAKHLLPRFESRPLASLTTHELQQWFYGLDLSKASANQFLKSVRAAFTMAYDQGLVPDKAAWTRVRLYKGADEARAYFLSPQEVTRLLAAAEPALRLHLQAQLFTGCRPGREVESLREFDGESVRVTTGKTGPRTVWLSDDGAAFFRAVALPLPRLRGRPFARARAAAGLPPEVVPYSLRHYYISRALAAGIQPVIVAENVGTSLSMIEKYYGKFLPSTRRNALNLLNLGGFNEE